MSKQDEEHSDIRSGHVSFGDANVLSDGVCDNQEHDPKWRPRREELGCLETSKILCDKDLLASLMCKRELGPRPASPGLNPGFTLKKKEEDYFDT